MVVAELAVGHARRPPAGACLRAEPTRIADGLVEQVPHREGPRRHPVGVRVRDGALPVTGRTHIECEKQGMPYPGAVQGEEPGQDRHRIAPVPVGRESAGQHHHVGVERSGHGGLLRVGGTDLDGRDRGLSPG